MRKKRNLMIAAAALAILLACYGLLKGANDRSAAAEEERQEAEVQLMSLSPDTVQAFSFQDGGTAYVFERDADGDWTYPADENFPVDEDIVSSLLRDLEDVDYTRRLEGVEDLAEYGLEEPSNIITATDAQGTEHTITVGNMNGSTGDYYIYLDEETDVVYTVESTIPLDFDLTLYDLVDAETFPAVAADEIARIQVEDAAEGRVEEFVKNEASSSQEPEEENEAQEDGQSWSAVVGEETLEADSDQVTALLDELGALYYQSCVEYYVEDLAAYGLDAPAYTIRIWTGAGGGEAETADIVLYIGAMDEGGDYYIMEEGSTQVHTIGASSVEELLHARAEDYLAQQP